MLTMGHYENLGYFYGSYGNDLKLRTLNEMRKCRETPCHLPSLFLISSGANYAHKCYLNSIPWNSFVVVDVGIGNLFLSSDFMRLNSTHGLDAFDIVMRIILKPQVGNFHGCFRWWTASCIKMRLSCYHRRLMIRANLCNSEWTFGIFFTTWNLFFVIFANKSFRSWTLNQWRSRWGLMITLRCSLVHWKNT